MEPQGTKREQKGTKMEQKGRIRVVVKQTITRESDNQIINEAVFTITCVNNKTGRIDMPEWILDKLFDHNAPNFYDKII